MTRHNDTVHYEMVSGYPMPARFAGHPALELCNTWSGWDEPPILGQPVDPQREYLADADRLAVWGGHVGLVTPPEVAGLRADDLDGAAARRALREARRLRAAIRVAALDPAAAQGFSVVAVAADSAVRMSHLRRSHGDGGGVGVARREVPISTGLMAVVHRAAMAAEGLLSGELVELVRACPGAGCGWLFLDPTGRRRWCSMTSCGNRAKVRAHAARHPS